jgi:NAD(P)-dependent dehydrogenase (short-subunit alcohol dehydrogenase family)
MVLTGTVSLVTGAASGIGRATALMLSQEGSAVAAVDRNESGLQAVVTKLGAFGPAKGIVADLADAKQARGVVGDAVTSLGRLDHLVNCAGITGRGGTILEVDEEGWAETFAVNVRAPLLLMQAFARHVVSRGGGGRIVNVTSSSAFRAKLSPIAYGSSKAALGQLTRSVAAELGKHDINVNAVAPGLTRTAMTEESGVEALRALAAGNGPLGNLLRRLSEPEDVAAVICFLCRPESRQVSGQTFHTSAGAVV